MEASLSLRMTRINAVCTRYYATDDLKEVRDSLDTLVGFKEPDVTVLIGSVLDANESKFKVNFIIHRGTNIYDLYAMESTDSSIFLVPAIADTRDRLLWNSHFMNAFLYTEESDTPKIRLLFRKGETSNYKEMSQYLKSHIDFFNVECPDDHTEMYVFRINDQFRDDFRKFLDGKYSKMSDQYKNKICQFHVLRKTHDIYGILYKTDARRKRVEDKIGQELPNEAELYHCLRSSRETYQNLYRITEDGGTILAPQVTSVIDIDR